MKNKLETIKQIVKSKSYVVVTDEVSILGTDFKEKMTDLLRLQSLKATYMALGTVISRVERELGLEAVTEDKPTKKRGRPAKKATTKKK